MAKREVFTTTPGKAGWENRNGAEVVSKHKTQAAAWDASRSSAKAVERAGGVAQARRKGEDGKIQTEHTYGDDPRKTKG